MAEIMQFNNSTGEIWFLAFCVELYKQAKKMTGREAFNYLSEKGATNFIIKHWDALHMTSQDYIIESIDDFIAP